MSMSSELAAAIEDDDLHIGQKQPSLVKNLESSNPTSSQHNQITAVQRMISACSGSFITSLVVTPFDVVRIRIQQQEVMQTISCCQNPVGSKTPQIQKPPGVFWLTQHYCNSAESCPRITLTFQGMVSIGRNEGISTLWRGLSLTLFMAIPSNIIYFTGYEYIRDHSPIKNEPINPLLCGMFARIMAATVVAPVELIKTRLQSIPSEMKNDQLKSRILKNLLQDSARSLKTRGIGSIFTGLNITLWRDVPFSGIYWLCYELFKDRIGQNLGVDFDAQQQDDWKVFSTSFASGSLGGIIAAFFTNPFDVGKTRLQIANENKPASNDLMFRFLVSIYKKEGISALYSGFGPRVMKIAPSCAIMISSYEFGKKIFKDKT